MGGFLLARRKTDLSIEETEKSLKNSLDVFLKKGLDLHKSIVIPDFIVYAFHKLAFPTENVVIFPDNQFIIATGTLIYKGKIGSEPLKQLFNDFTENGEFLNQTFGQYCLIIYKKDKLYILNDPGGIYPVYIEKNENVFSSSFLALSKMQQSPQILREPGLNLALLTSGIFALVYYSMLYTTWTVNRISVSPGLMGVVGSGAPSAPPFR